MTRLATPRLGAPRGPACAVAVLLLAAGCTICPDPYDYSGPVPDGSAPQNDFRARANGIAPIGGVPQPWPPVVRATPSGAADAPAVLAAAEEPDAGATDESAGAEPATMQSVAAEATVDPTADAAPVQPVIQEPTLEEILPPAPPPLRETGPLRETPGWRPRR